jgi:predicted porin
MTVSRALDLSASLNMHQPGTDYFLSKRTDVYFVGIYQKASGTDSTGSAAVVAINGVTPSNDNHQVVLRVGMRHKF